MRRIGIIYFILHFCVSCDKNHSNEEESSLTSEISLTYIKVPKSSSFSDVLIANIKFINTSKHGFFFYQPRLRIDTTSAAKNPALIKRSFINKEFSKKNLAKDSILNKNLLKLFDENKNTNSLLLKNYFIVTLKTREDESIDFDELIFLKSGEDIVKRYFLGDILSKKVLPLVSDTIILRAKNKVLTIHNTDPGELYFLNNVPKTFNKYHFFNGRIKSDSLVIIRKGFDLVNVSDFLSNDVIINVH